MPIDPAMLAKSLGTLNDLDPIRDLAATLQQAVRAAKQLFDADADGNLHWASASDQRAQALEDNQEIFAAGPCAEAYTTGQPAVMHDATMEQRWGEIALTFVEVQIGTVALSDHPVRLPPLRRSKTTDHRHGRVVRPSLGALPRRRASTLPGFPVHPGSMQQCRLVGAWQPGQGR
jgi:hypothetical protein